MHAEVCGINDAEHNCQQWDKEQMNAVFIPEASCSRSMVRPAEVISESIIGTISANREMPHTMVVKSIHREDVMHLAQISWEERTGRVNIR